MRDVRDAAALAALLGRPERNLLTPATRRELVGQRVLVTGAGGSIGSEVARQLARCRPSRLTLVDNCELNLFQIESELRELAPKVTIDPRLLDISRSPAVSAAFRGARPNVVFHAAAYKHITMTERDVCAAVQTNVLGTWYVVRGARQVGSRMVLISSDKASAPRSVMGATKRLAERVTLSAASKFFRPVAVRFGNVLGSSGSVISVMLDRIRAGRPIEVTDPEAERFFMTAREAASLVLIADRMGKSPAIYWLDMGPTVRIGDLVERLFTMTEAAGMSRVPVRVIGLRPGEKMREELAPDDLELTPTRNRHISVAREPHSLAATSLNALMRALRDNVRRNDALGALANLCIGVPEFKPTALARKAAAQATVEGAQGATASKGALTA